MTMNFHSKFAQNAFGDKHTKPMETKSLERSTNMDIRSKDPTTAVDGHAGARSQMRSYGGQETKESSLGPRNIEA